MPITSCISRTSGWDTRTGDRVGSGITAEDKGRTCGVKVDIREAVKKANKDIPTIRERATGMHAEMLITPDTVATTVGKVMATMSEETVAMEVDAESTMVETEVIVGVKGPIPTPQVPKIKNGSSVARRPTTVEVGLDKLGTTYDNGGSVRG